MQAGLRSPADQINTLVRSDTPGLLDLQEAFTREYQQARDFIDGDVGPERAQATKYYLGQPFGNEEEGRSQVISRDVRDTILNYLPSTMRVLFGGEKAVEYVPINESDVPFAEQATDYVNLVVLRQDNDGFLECYAAVKDALTRKVGFLKWWWDTRLTITGSSYSGLDETALTKLAHDPEISELQVTRQPDQINPTYDCTATRTVKTGRARFSSVPPEEVLINREARSFRDARAVFHRRTMLVTDLVAMGFDLDDILDGAQSSSSLEGNQEAIARLPGGIAYVDSGSSDLLRKVLYVEGYLLTEVEGEPIASLHKVCALGDVGHILTLKGQPAVERIDRIPFASLCPDPEPHTFFGLCPADLTMDIQRIKSDIQRGMLDSLSLSIEPRTEVVEGQVNLHDLMNPEVNRIIRVRSPGQMREVSTPFLGNDCLPVLSYYDQVVQQRTKQNDASQGLDADALQSTTKAGVAATINAAQAQQELTARIFAEGGWRDLFRGLLQLLVRNQDQPRMVRLRDKWVPIDPRQWNAEMDVAINVALGAGTHEDKINYLTAIAAKQEQIIQTLGANNPLVTPQQYRYTLGKMVEMAGFRDASQFFTVLPPDYKVPDTPPTPDATQVLAQVQMAELNLKAQIEAAKIQFEKYKADLNSSDLRYRADVAAHASVMQGEARAGMQFQQAQIDAVTDAAAQQTDAETQKHLTLIKAISDHAQAGQQQGADMQQTAMEHGSQMMQQAQQHQHEQQMQANAPTPGSAE